MLSARGRDSTLTNFSLSPRHFDTIDEADMLKKVVRHSVATALASMVLPEQMLQFSTVGRKDASNVTVFGCVKPHGILPVPGGPNNRTPFHGFSSPVNSCGNLKH